MSRNQRLGLLAGAVVVLVVGFIVLKPGSDDSSDSSSDSTTPAASAGATTAQPKAVATTIVVRDAKPVGGVKVLKFKKGDKIAFAVDSDTADEIHVHGYDKHADIPKGGTVRFNFPGKIDGKFVVELENHKQEIASLEVAP